MTSPTTAHTGESSLPGFLFLAYACACLALALYLSHAPLRPHPAPVALPPKAADLPDFTRIRDIHAKKTAFFDYLRPVVEAQNRRMRETRAHLLDLQAQLTRGEALNDDQLYDLQQLARRFHLEPAAPEQMLAYLLVRADELPSAMVLTQAAMESAWGTSRFARKANNLFGQWCFTSGCGLVPRRRPDGTFHEVKIFANVEDAIESYFLNINTHAAYRKLRGLRAQARLEGRSLRAMELVAGLEKYSVRGLRYIEELREMIRDNHLEEGATVGAL